MSKHRATILSRLRELEADGRSVLARAAVAIRDCKAHSARVAAMIGELRQTDETTAKLPTLRPDGGER